MKHRYIEIDICKAICIILVVIGHSGCPSFLHHFLNLFHMAVFFAVSGFCYSKKHDYKPIKYLLRKIQTIYVPYIIFGLILVFLHNFFFKINIYTDNPMFLSLPYGNSFGITYRYELSDILNRIIRTLYFANTEMLGGATWFLRILFLINIFHCYTRYIYIRITNSEKSVEYFSMILGIISLIIGSYFNSNSIHLAYDIQSFFSSYFTFTIGIGFKLFINHFENKTSTFKLIINIIISFLVLITYGNKGNLGVGSNSIVDPIFFATMSICGLIFIYSFSKIIVKLLTKYFNHLLDVITLIGRNTLIILFLHFISFKLITLLQILITNKPIIYLACFPVANPTSGYWILYTVAGVTLPILYKMLYNKIILFLKNKIALKN